VPVVVPPVFVGLFPFSVWVRLSGNAGGSCAKALGEYTSANARKTKRVNNLNLSRVSFNLFIQEGLLISSNAKDFCFYRSVAKDLYF
jgi:hypothetical protein